MAAVTNLGFVKVGNFKCRTCSEGQIPCQISCRSVKPLLRYRDFGIFQDGDRWNLVFLKFQICNGRNGQEDRTASPWYISSKSLKQRPRYGEFSINSKWIFEITIFNGETRHEYQIASPCQISWRSAKPLQFINLFLLCPNAVAAMQVTSLVLSTTRCQIGLPALVFQESLPRFMTRNLYRTDLAKSSSPDQWYFSYKNHFSLGFS